MKFHSWNADLFPALLLGADVRTKEKAMNRLAAKEQRDRSHIAIDDTESLRRWAKHLEVTEDELRNTIERVGNSAAAVRKEINSRKKPKPACEQPPPEEDFGGGDIVSVEAEPSTDDDQPL